MTSKSPNKMARSRRRSASGHFPPEIILWGVRWYCPYPISYRQLSEMMCDRGVEVDHSTLSRWVQKYAPELDKRCPTGNRSRLRRSQFHARALSPVSQRGHGGFPSCATANPQGVENWRRKPSLIALSHRPHLKPSNDTRARR